MGLHHKMQLKNYVLQIQTIENENFHFFDILISEKRKDRRVCSEIKVPIPSNEVPRVLEWDWVMKYEAHLIIQKLQLLQIDPS